MNIDLELHEKQGLALKSTATEILYGGSAGSGKSHLMRVVSILWCLEIPGLQVYLFRRLSDDLYKNHMEGAGGYYALLTDLIDKGHVKYNGSKNFLGFSNGSKIWLCHCQYEKDKYKYQGPEIHALLIDELTHFSETIYRFLRGRCRIGSLKLPEKYANQFPRILCGTNPGGVGHNWVKRVFIDTLTPFKIIKTTREEGGMLRQFIPAKLQDNPSLDEDYQERLEGLGNPALVKALLEGNWDIVDGGAFDDLWDRGIHVIEPFNIPADWRVDRSFDWGSSHPFSVGWWAESTGEEITDHKGDKIMYPAGSLIRIAEWYGGTVGNNKGLRLSAREIAEGIVEREESMRKRGAIARSPMPGPADGQIFNVAEEESGSIAKLMYGAVPQHPVKWVRADKRPGSRVNGYQMVRDYLKNSINGEGAGLYFFNNCKAAIATLPVLEMDANRPDDVNTKMEDHAYDDIRYRVLANATQYAKEIDCSFVF